MYKILYKWTTYQAPVLKTIDHFLKSINEKKPKWKTLKPELQISPFIYKNNKVYYMPIFDIETLDFTYYKKDLFNCYCFTGRGIHLFSNHIYQFNNIEQDLANLKNIQYKSIVDVITTFKITPIRFFNSFSTKYNIWLWHRTKKNNDYNLLFEQGLDENYKDLDAIIYDIEQFIKNIKIVGDINDFIKKIEKI